MRNLARWCALAGLLVALGVTAPAQSVPRRQLPLCTAGAASTRPPTGPAGAGSPRACRAVVREAAAVPILPTPSGYHHLGAATSDEWSGVSGRFSVVDSEIRANTYDFTAARFMVKRDLGSGKISWLEAGWAATGWSSPGKPRIYTFNTNSKAWQFYDQYSIKPGDTVWLDLHSDTVGVWQAWLWWNNRWNLLTAQKLALGASALVEQYVEVHVDASKPTEIVMPAVKVDNVQLRPIGGGTPRYWRDDVPTLTGTLPGQQMIRGGFCLNWLTRYDTWTAGNCT
ncbi:hypothetical protein [Actinoplanes sp. NPDC051851]|uniref:hypothetical protein n=1 Tax=Actinoplanes sp. NPDC051851 TaxID=3154753 RepID=UPI00344492ED